MDTSSVTKYASGTARTCSEGLRRSTVAHFARKVRGTNIVAAKHGLSPPKKKSRRHLTFEFFAVYIVEMNRKEFENIVPELRPLMVKVARDFFGNQDDAEDVAQDALVRLWNYCERLDANRNMKQLAIMVTKNCCIDTYKRRQMMVEVPCSDERMAGETYQADAEVVAQETRGRIDSAIRCLSPREQQLVRKRYLEDHSAEEIARETGIPKPSVKSMLSGAKAKLIRILKKTGHEAQ